MSGNTPPTPTAPTPAVEPPAPQAAPWGEPTAEWKIGDQPWYNVVVPDGPARQLFADKKYANPTAAANAYYELNRVASSANGDNTLVLPSENATSEDWNKFYTKLGRPASAEGYDKVNWGENAHPEMVDFGKQVAFKLGLSPKMVEGVLAKEWNDFVVKQNNTNTEAGRTANEAVLTELKANWGDKFNTHLAAGNRVLNALKGQGITEADLSAVEAHIGVAPLVKLLATIGKLSGEGSFVSGAPAATSSDPAQMTPEQAAAEVKRLGSDVEFQKAYTQRTHAGHADAVVRMSALYAKAGNSIAL